MLLLEFFLHAFNLALPHDGKPVNRVDSYQLKRAVVRQLSSHEQLDETESEKLQQVVF